MLKHKNFWNYCCYLKEVFISYTKIPVGQAVEKNIINLQKYNDDNDDDALQNVVMCQESVREDKMYDVDLQIVFRISSLSKQWQNMQNTVASEQTAVCLISPFYSVYRELKRDDDISLMVS